MIRLLFAVVCAVALGGCKGSEARIPIDPFYGQTKIPPPGTGQMSRRPAVDPYYPHRAATAPQGVPQASEGLAATSEAASGAASPPGPAEANTAPPPAGQLAGQPKGDQIEIPGSARRSIPIGSEATVASPSSLAASPPSRPAAAAPSAAASAASLATSNPRYGNNAASTDLSTRERITRVLEPRPAIATNRNSWSTTGTASPAAVTRQSVDIMDLPPAGTSGAYRGSQTSDSTGQVRLTSATEPVTDSAAQDSRTATGAAASAAAASTGKRLGE